MCAEDNMTTEDQNSLDSMSYLNMFPKRKGKDKIEKMFNAGYHTKGPICNATAMSQKQKKKKKRKTKGVHHAMMLRQEKKSRRKKKMPDIFSFIFSKPVKWGKIASTMQKRKSKRNHTRRSQVETSAKKDLAETR